MPYLQLARTQFQLLEGETRVGRDDSADVRLPSETDAHGIDLVITVRSDQSASVRRESTTAAIAINGVTLGTQPSPLFHGDRLDIDGVPLVFGEEAQAGMTTQIAAIGSEKAPPPAERVGRRGRAGGRMVSLIDGREYTARSDGLTIGREAGCDVVISAADVSRRHARIDLKPEGYVIVDLSTNGVLVNGIRVKASHPLARGDVIRIGPEEFRFHADTGSDAEPPPPPVILATPPATPRPAPTPDWVKTLEPFPVAAPPVPAEASSSPVADSAPRPAPLATLESVQEGTGKGQRFELTSPLTHIGRGGHNDVVLADDSVSDTHAKIHRRENGWFVVDIDSTNGTYVGGRRVLGEIIITSGMEVRFGDSRLTFRSVPNTLPGSARGLPGRTGTPRSRVAIPTGGDHAPPVRTAEPTPVGLPKALLGGILVLAVLVLLLILRTL